MLGLAFLFIGLMPASKSPALDLLWGSIMTNTRGDILLLAVVVAVVVGLVSVFYKETQATVFHQSRRWGEIPPLEATLGCMPRLTFHQL